MKMETIDLSNLPKHWYKLAQKETEEHKVPKSNDPLVDGTLMTVNPEIKHRRKRIMSQQNYKTKRPRIAEFINACKFLAGETSKVFPLSMQHQNILSLVRNDKEVPEHYQSVVSHNIDLVQKAAKLKPKEIKEKYCTIPIKEKETEQMQRKVNPKNVRVSEQAGNKFKEWLLNNLSDVPFEEKQEDMRYAAIVSYYRNHNGEIADYMPKHSKTILDEHVNELQNYITSKNRLKKVHNEKANTKSIEACDAVKVAMTPITLSEQNTEVVKAIPDYPASLKTQDALDALSMITMLANKASAILDEHTNELQNYVTSKNRLKKVNEDNVDAKCITSLPKQKTVVNEVITELSSQSKVEDALSMIIMLAKKAGATELVIKL